MVYFFCYLKGPHSFYYKKPVSELMGKKEPDKFDVAGKSVNKFNSLKHAIWFTVKVDSLPIKPYWTKIWEYLLVWLCAVSQKSCIFVQVCNSYSSQAPSAGFLIYNMLLRFLRSVQSSTRFKNKTLWKSWFTWRFLVTVKNVIECHCNIDQFFNAK